MPVRATTSESKGFLNFMEVIEYYKNLDLTNIVYANEFGIKCVEIWRDIPEYVGYYQSSDLGRIKGLTRHILKNNFKSLVKGQIIKQSLDNGYCRVTLRKQGVVSKQYVHIIVAKTFIPNPENKPEVNHLKKMPCGKKMNTFDNRVVSLAWSTRGENMQYGYDFGFKCAKGENNGRSKLTEKQVLEIRAIGKYKNYTKEMSIKYGVCEKYISDIMNRKRWTHLP